jgi:hypothetical protein
MILNYDIDNSFDMRLRLNTDAISGSETLKINVDASVAKEITETIPANATVLMFLSPDGHYIGKYTYDQDDVDANKAPTFEVYQPARAKKVFAHYLPWYDVDGQYDGTLRKGWCHEGDCTDLTNNSSVYEPLIGEYSQFDEEVIKYHVRQAIAARIDGFMVNMNPEWDYAWKIFHKICDAIIAVNDECPSNDFKVAISFDNSTETDLTNITNLFQLCKDSLYGHPKFIDIAWTDDVTGKYVMTVWSEADWTDYRTAINSVFEQDSIFAIGRNVINFDLFDGNMEWFAYLNSDQSNTSNWGEQHFQDSDWLMARQESNGLKDIRSVNPFKLGSAYPGFDDRNVPNYWNSGNHRFFTRNADDGETMSLTWDKHINYTSKRLGGDLDISADWIQLVTWNDFPEGTSVEPSTIGTDYGYVALQTNRKKIAEFKTVTTTTADTFGIYVAKAVYDAVKAGRTSDANTALTYFCNKEYENAIAFAENGTLPVELLSFNGFYERNKNVLNWKVGEKINHALFEIQHSQDGIHFETIGFDYENVDNYTFHHIAPPKGVNYYRLKQNDLDDIFSFSKTISIQVPVSSIKIITRNNEIEFITDQNIDKIEVYNILGQQLEVDFDGQILSVDYNGVLWVKYLINGVWLSEKVIVH